MSYSVGKIYTDHALMDEIVYNCKLIMQGIVLKNEAAADKNETSHSILAAQDLKNVVEDKYSFLYFPFTSADFVEYGYSNREAAHLMENLDEVPVEERDDLLVIGKRNFINNYVEENNYYRMLNGLPNYTSDDPAYIERAERVYVYVAAGTIQTAKFSINDYGYVYVGYKNPAIMANPDISADLPLAAPIHTWSSYELSILKYLGIYDEIINEYGKRSDCQYLKNLGIDKLDYYEARKVEKWGILRMPSCYSLVQDEFKRFFELERADYLRKTDQLALSYGSDYYDEMMMLDMLCQTFADMIVDVPEWYIRRDIFDLRSVQYFLEANDIAFYKQIPLRYQIRIVKNINKLIKFKSTEQNIQDILEIFSLKGTTVYRYYLIKKFLFNVNGRISDEDLGEDVDYDFGFDDEDTYERDPDNPDVVDLNFFDEEHNTFYPQYKNVAVFDFSIWAQDDEVVLDDYDFGEMPDDGEPYVPSPPEDTKELNFYDETYDDFDPSYKNLEVYDFGNMNGSDVKTLDDINEMENYQESLKTYQDEYGNVYELIFARSPIDENYDNYIRDPFNQYSYDAITTQDKYWDGEDTHNLVKNQHLTLDTNVDGTKYLSLDYKVSMEEFSYQVEYFLGMIFTTKIDNSAIKIPVSVINPNVSYSLTDIFMLLHVLSYAYNGRTCSIKIPHKKAIADKPEYTNYKLVDGGYPWSGSQVDPDWKLEDLDFGCEEEDEIQWSGLEEDDLDFGFNVSINMRGYYRDYDFGKAYADEFVYEIDDFGCMETDSFYPSLSPSTIFDFGYNSDAAPDADEDEFDYGFNYVYEPPEPSDDYGIEESDTVDPEEDLNFGSEEVDTFGRAIEDYDYELMNIIDNFNGHLLMAPSRSVTTYTENLNFVTKRNEALLEPLKAPNKPDSYNITVSADENLGTLLGSSSKWIFGDLYDFLDENPEYVEPRDNCTWTDSDYEFKNEDRGDTYSEREKLREYNFQAETESEIWETVDPGVYLPEDICDAGDVSDLNAQNKYRKRIDGGDKEFSVVTHDTFFDWIRTNHPDMWVDKTCRIYGFDFDADLEAIKNNMNLAHSNFYFRDSFGAELNLSGNQITFPKLFDENGNPTSFKKPLNKVVQSYDELYDIYETNTKLYNVLKDRIGNPESHDALVFYQYLFDSLFTTSFDFTLYLDNSGNPMATYDEVLRNRNFSLYEFYRGLIQENDDEAMKDNIRQVINSIVDTLEYYLKGSNLQYIYSFLPVFDFRALTNYMLLMLKFFKSWKVYFLDATNTYFIGDNGSGQMDKVIKSDMLAERRITHLDQDSFGMRDGMQVSYSFEHSEDKLLNKEVIDTYQFRQTAVETIYLFDGGSPDVEVSHEEALSVMTFDKSSLDGGEVGNIGPKYNIDSGVVGAGLDIYNLEGGSPYTQRFYLTVNGGEISECNDDKYTKRPKIDGGGIDDRIYQTDTIWSHTEKQTIINDAKLSRKPTNRLVITDDGLYLKDDMATIDEFNNLKLNLITTRSTQTYNFDRYYEFAIAANDDDALRRLVYNTTDEILAPANKCKAEILEGGGFDKLKNQIDVPIEEFTEWFDEINPFKWEMF